MAEYAATYGGLPDPGSPWPLFLALIDRVGRFEARARLRLLDSVAAGIGTAFTGESGARDQLHRLAFPAAPVARPSVLNLARDPQPEATTDG